MENPLGWMLILSLTEKRPKISVKPGKCVKIAISTNKLDFLLTKYTNIQIILKISKNFTFQSSNID